MTSTKFLIGDRVAYTNDYGVTFHNKNITKVIQVPNDPSFGTWAGQTRYHIDGDAPWFPVPERSLTLEAAE